MNVDIRKPLVPAGPPPAWSPMLRLVLAITCAAVFAGVWLFAGKDSPRSDANVAQPMTTTLVPASSTPTPMPRTPTDPSATVIPETPSPDDPVVPDNETAAAKLEERRDAIRRLATSGDADAIPRLIDAARNDTDVHVRIYAIDALGHAAIAGNPDRAITDVLHETSSSENAIVAAHARNSLDKITRARGTPQP